MKWAPQGLEKVSEWKRRVGAVPLVAIGGLTIERAPGVLAAGADILSVVTDITLNADPEARTRAWLAATAQERTSYEHKQSGGGCRRDLASGVASGGRARQSVAVGKRGSGRCRPGWPRIIQN